MQRWKCCSSWSKQNPKHFSNTGFPQGKPVFFCGDIGQNRVIGKNRQHPAAPLKSSVVRALASLKQEEGRTKRVAKKCFKLLRYRVFSAYIFPAPEWLGENVGEHTVCPSCGESCGVIGQKESVKNVPCTGMAGEKVGEHTVCSSCGGPCMKEGQSSSNGGVHRKGVV